MVFKRRDPRTWGQSFVEFFYPRGGWSRAARYVAHRLRRLPDPAHKISRGIAAGVFASFTPFFGLHFLTAGLIAWLLRGNILAALLATFFGNPITFPVIAAISVELGTVILDRPHIPPQEILIAFSIVSVELWSNFIAIFTSDPVVWDGVRGFWSRIFVPYLVGGIVPGLIAAVTAYYLANPIIASYQRGRLARMRTRLEARRRLAEAARSRAERAEAAKKADDGAAAD